MSWLTHYRLVLLDFDGLLVDTERLHYWAYIEICRKRGYTLDLTFDAYCAIAHMSSKGLREMIYTRFPTLQQTEPDWETLYADKQATMRALLEAGHGTLMEGVENFLQLVMTHGLTCCVVTNSPLSLVNVLKSQQASLRAIPHWITRETYSRPKPDPECYQLALQRYGHLGPAIGFEDTLRGIYALQQTEAQPVLICSKSHPCLQGPLDPGIFHLESLREISPTSPLLPPRIN